ncbi:G5 domain-containing protein [Alicyclobacillus cycloheptanicus]|uniref:3D (Asp-Asp-Asp) domain-containing protein n=1 Tax=Alicyclobacillus cycloheptanicus TaxID=1457 RepID=A0ABT9XDU9_9BACL|nr:3D domain-containing protein [Alicyclobacillus cycloheptanicus]MDQ0188315.1 3D (Asp-Asp-Asp) domain-containing protein [Alicyclobacillus cycloheptanicus]WDM01029.1 G5 domain-containing protein [Alicyclobacillus cycloheptanicus]
MRLPKSTALYVSAAVAMLIGVTGANLHASANETSRVHDNGPRKIGQGTTEQSSFSDGQTIGEAETFLSRPKPLGPQPKTDTVHMFVEVKTQEIPFQTLRRYTDRLYQGQQRVLTYGVKGLLRIQSPCVYQDGTITNYHTMRQIVHQPRDEVIEVGTAHRPAPAASRSTVASRSDSSMIPMGTLTVVATAYVAGGRTSTGMAAEPGVVAVDPRVIPLGTKLYIPGIGVVRAEDTGGAIVGDRIDICVATQAEADAWGERTIKIYEIQ